MMSCSPTITEKLTPRAMITKELMRLSPAPRRCNPMRMKILRYLMPSLLLSVLVDCSIGEQSQVPSSYDIGRAMRQDQELNVGPTQIDQNLMAVISKCWEGFRANPSEPNLSIVSMKVARVKRLECVKATGKPGHVCSFEFDLAVNSVPRNIGTVTRNCEARFVKGSTA